MIKVCFLPGCYGNYLGQCLYYYTNLNTNKNGNFSLDQLGSSHAFRDNKEARQYIQVGHPGSSVKFLADDTVVAISNDSAHWLDYCNNHFSKEQQQNLIRTVVDNFSVEEIEHKLQSYWNYSGVLDNHVPGWILREFVSFCIGDTLYHSYGTDQCNINTAKAVISTQNFFIGFLDSFKDLCNTLSLTLTVDDNTITAHNQTFVDAQRYHGSQLSCEQWIHAILNNVNEPSPLQTVIDEAYVQYRLRQQGYEIQCDGLEQFPNNSQDMIKLIYKI